MGGGKGKHAAVLVFKGHSADEIGRRLRDAVSGRGRLNLDALQGQGPLSAALVVESPPQALRHRLGWAAARLAQSQGAPVVEEHEGLYFEPVPPGPGALAFLFPGQGSQRVGMLASLRQAMPALSAHIAALDPDGRWRRLIDGPGTMAGAEAQALAEKSLRDTRHAQPAIGLLSLALAQTLLEIGIRPRFAAGHSYGELPSLALAGAFDGATLMQLSQARGRCLGEAGDAQAGAMLALRASTQEIESLLSQLQAASAQIEVPGPWELVLANCNAPRQGVLAGSEEAIARAATLADAQHLQSKRLHTACAFHSPLMAGALPHWRRALAGTEIAPPRVVTVVGNVDASPYPQTAEAVRERLAEQVVSPVRWADSMRALHGLGARVFLEVGPGRALTELTGQNLQGLPFIALACDPGAQDPHRHVAHLLARLTALGLSPSLGPWAFELEDHNEAGAHPGAEPRRESVPPVSLSSAPMNTALDTFLDLNGQALSCFFAQQSALVGLCRDAAPDTREQLFKTLVSANQQALSHYLHTQQQAVMGASTLSLPIQAEVATVSTPLTEHAGQALGATCTPPVPPVPPVAPGIAMTVPSAASAPADDTPGSEPWFRALIAQLTGFPPHMVRRDSDFEADLGLDSLSMVEVWFALVDAFPALEERREAFRRCRCIEDGMTLILDLMPQPSSGMATSAAESVSLPTEPPAEAPGQTLAESPPLMPSEALARMTPSDRLRHKVLARIAAVKGLDVARVSPEADLERDLGLDVFTRGDLCEELLLRRPALAVAGRELLHAPTVNALVALCDRVLGLHDTPEQAPEDSRQVEAPGLVAPSAGALLSRNVRVDVPVLPWVPARGPLPAQLLLAGVAGPLFDHLHAALAGQGVVVEAWHVSAQGFRSTTASGACAIGMDDEEGLAHAWPQRTGPSAVLFVAGEADGGPWSEQVEVAACAPFMLAKAFRQRALTWFGVLGDARGGPAWAASRGVARTLAREWPNTRVRTLWIDGPLESADAARVVDVFCTGASEQDLLFRQGRMFQRRLEPRPLTQRQAHPPLLGPDATVLLLGGGDGITAEVAVALAARYRCRVALVGRTPCPAAYPYPEAGDDEALRGILADEVRRASAQAAAEAGDVRSEAEQLRVCLQRVLRERAVFTTCQRIEAAGGQPCHEAADVTDRAAFSQALNRIRQRCGPLSGVVHGVGLAEDALLARKSPASFRRVLRAKTESVALLRELTQDDPLQFAFLFSSLSAHAGTPGQVDYVAANEVLGEVAEAWNQDADYPVRALLWSVWSETGLASAALVRQMSRLGLPGISNRVGTAQFEDELTHGSPQESWVLLAPEATLAYALHAEPAPVAAPRPTVEEASADA